MRRPDIPVLTSLRFPAAFAILLYHFLAYTRTPRWVWEGFGEGVSFFYVLSGFILYYNYFDLPDRRAFWVARFARIWPVHLVTLLLVLVALPWGWQLGHGSWRITLPANILLLQAWLPFEGSALSFNGVSWSLSVEAFFYFSFPFLLPAIKARGSALPLMAAFATGFAIMVGATLLAPANAPFIGSFNPLCRLFEFVLGMATCRLWLGSGRDQRSIARWSGLEFAAIVITLGVVVFLPQLLHGTGAAKPFLAWLELEFCALIFAAVIWTFAHQAGAISKVLSARAFEWSGEISFGLYMSHQILLRWLNPHFTSGAGWVFVYLLMYAAAAVALAGAIFHLVETPARHAIVSAFKRHRKQVAPV